MEEIAKLSALMYVLDSSSDILISNLSEDELNYFKSELVKLKSVLESSMNDVVLSEVAKDFFKTLTNINYLQDLAREVSPKMRYGSTPEIEEQIRIKLVKACDVLISRLNM